MDVLSKNKIKYIKSLELKKNRKKEEAFIAESPKLVEDLINYFHCKLLVATEDFLHSHANVEADEIMVVNTKELAKASLLKTPQNVLAIFSTPRYNFDEKILKNHLILALDNVQDPGNLGTIIRLADWFGIEHIVCSETCADIYNPKTIQSTMGAIGRVKVHYTNLLELLQRTDVPIYGTFLDGENMYNMELSTHGIIVMGNEGNGISKEIEACVTKKLYIPNFPCDRTTSESLNVATATAIVCAEFRRQAALR